jgi:branched-chain amino acid transport system substrate-binding protein
MFGISAQALSPTFWNDTNGAADGVPSHAIANSDVAVTSKTKPFAQASQGQVRQTTGLYRLHRL